jgi:hypothetical protein
MSSASRQSGSDPSQQPPDWNRASGPCSRTSFPSIAFAAGVAVMNVDSRLLGIERPFLFEMNATVAA